jgi:hypothetical protein
MLDLRMEICDVLGLRNSTAAFLCLCSAHEGAESMTMNTGEQEILHRTSCIHNSDGLEFLQEQFKHFAQ